MFSMSVEDDNQSSESSNGSDISLFNRVRQLAPDLNRTSSQLSSSVSSDSSESNEEHNILVTGSKYTGKSSLCETLVLLLANNEEYKYEYIDVNHYRDQFKKLSLPLSDEIKTMVKKKLNDGNILIEDTSFDIYYKNSFSAIFILKTDDDELEKRLISHGDFHTPYNDFHVMEPYNSVCEKFPYTSDNKIFILDNTLRRHLDINARFIKKCVDEYINPPDKNQLKSLDSDGESHRSDSDDSDADETLIHTDGKFKKRFVAPELLPELSTSSD